MASGRPVVGEKNRSTAIVPIRIPAEDDEDQEDPRLSDVDEWGRSERTRALARALYEPDLLELVPRRVGGAREDPHRGRRPPRRQPRRRHPLRRAGHHARHREGAGPPRLRHGRLLLPDGARGRDAVGPRRRRARPTPTTPTACCGSRASWRSSSPRGPRARRSPSRDRYRLRRFGRGGFVEIAMRAGVPVIPIAVVGAEESMPIVFRLPDAGQGPRRPLLPGHRQHARLRSARRRRCPSRPSSSCGCSTRCPSTCRPTRSATRRAGSWKRPSTSAHTAGGHLRHAARPAQRLVRVSRPWAGASSSPVPTPSGAAAWSRPSRPTPSMDVILGMGTHAPVGPLRAGRVRPGRPDLLDPEPHREGHPGRHHRPHVPGHGLDDGAATGPARDQRDRDDEPPGRGRARPARRCATSW